MPDPSEILTEIDQKRKSIHEHGDPPAKRPRTQVKTVIREKSKANSSKISSSKKKSAKPKKAPKPKKHKKEDEVAPSERRRSSRAHKVSDYKERADEDDEEEMLEGVAEWHYGEENSDVEESGSDEGSELSDDDEDDDDAESVDEGEEAEEEAEGEGEEEHEEEAPAKRKGSKVASSPKGKASASVKASVLAKLDRTSRARGRGGRATRDDSDMEVDE